MTLLHKHKINGGFLAPDRIPMEERNKNEMILELQNEVHIKDKEIERLNNIINKLENEKEKLYNLCETNNICYLQGLEDSEKINDFKYSDFVKKWLKDTKEKLQRGDIYEQSNNDRKE